MKTDNLKTLKTLTLGAALSVLLAVGWMMNERNTHADLMEEYHAVKRDTSEYDALKRHRSAQENQNDLSYLISHPLLIKQEKRGGRLYLEYANLPSSDFNEIANRLLNSALVIKKISLTRQNGAKGNIVVELES